MDFNWSVTHGSWSNYNWCLCGFMWCGLFRLNDAAHRSSLMFYSIIVNLCYRFMFHLIKCQMNMSFFFLFVFCQLCWPNEQCLFRVRMIKLISRLKRKSIMTEWHLDLKANFPNFWSHRLPWSSQFRHFQFKVDLILRWSYSFLFS